MIGLSGAWDRGSGCNTLIKTRYQTIGEACKQRGHPTKLPKIIYRPPVIQYAVSYAGSQESGLRSSEINISPAKHPTNTIITACMQYPSA